MITHLTRAIVLILMCACPVAAQDATPPPDDGTAQADPAQTSAPNLGMDRWAFLLSLAGPAANVTTQEIAFAHFGVYDQLVPRRIGLGAVNMALPFVLRWAMRKSPRGSANGEAVILAAWGFFDAGQNIHVLVTLKLPTK